MCYLYFLSIRKYNISALKCTVSEPQTRAGPLLHFFPPSHCLHLSMPSSSPVTVLYCSQQDRRVGLYDQFSCNSCGLCQDMEHRLGAALRSGSSVLTAVVSANTAIHTVHSTQYIPILYCTVHNTVLYPHKKPSLGPSFPSLPSVTFFTSVKSKMATIFLFFIFLFFLLCASGRGGGGRGV